MTKQALLSFLALLLAANVNAAQGGIRPAGQPVRDTYIVVLHGAPPAAIENTRNQLAATHGAKIIAVYDTVFQGFAMEASRGVAEAVNRDPRVAIVEEDNLGEMAAGKYVPGNWALDRIDNRTNPRLDSYYTTCQIGNNVVAYVFDTGIWAEHDEFSNQFTNASGSTNRVTPGYDVFRVQDNSLNPAGNSANPCAMLPDESVYSTGTGAATHAASHGTGVASIIGGKNHGVAWNTFLRPVRVAWCDGSVSASNVLRGVNWVLGQYGEDQWNPTTQQYEYVCVNSTDGSCLPREDYIAGITGDIAYSALPRVVNMSFTMRYPNVSANTITTLEQAVQKLVAANITVVVAAGNGGEPIEGQGYFYSPARLGSQVNGVITVGGTKGALATDVDSRWDNGGMDANNSASNYGGVDIWAPARNVPSAHWATNGARDPYAVRQHPYNIGTSWAAPLVTGMVVRTLELYPSWTPAQIEADLKADATKVNTIWNGTFSTENLLWGGMCRIRIVGH